MRDTRFLLPDCWWPGRDVYMPGTNASVVLSHVPAPLRVDAHGLLKWIGSRYESR
jgi:hypothetical protein